MRVISRKYLEENRKSNSEFHLDLITSVRKKIRKEGIKEMEHPHLGRLFGEGMEDEWNREQPIFFFANYYNKWRQSKRTQMKTILPIEDEMDDYLLWMNESLERQNEKKSKFLYQLQQKEDLLRRLDEIRVNGEVLEVGV